MSHMERIFQTLSIEALQLELGEIIGIRLKVLKDDEKLYISQCFVLKKSWQKYFWNSKLINLWQASWLGLFNIPGDRKKLNLHSSDSIVYGD